MKDQMYMLTTRLTANPWRARAVVFGILVALALLAGAVGVEAGPAGISPVP